MTVEFSDVTAVNSGDRRNVVVYHPGDSELRLRVRLESYGPNNGGGWEVTTSQRWSPYLDMWVSHDFVNPPRSGFVESGGSAEVSDTGLLVQGS